MHMCQKARRLASAHAIKGHVHALGGSRAKKRKCCSLVAISVEGARTSSEDVSSFLQSVAGKLLFVRHQLSIFVDAGIKVFMFL